MEQCVRNIHTNQQNNFYEYKPVSQSIFKHKRIEKQVEF